MTHPYTVFPFIYLCCNACHSETRPCYFWNAWKNVWKPAQSHTRESTAKAWFSFRLRIINILCASSMARNVTKLWLTALNAKFSMGWRLLHFVTAKMKLSKNRNQVFRFTGKMGQHLFSQLLSHLLISSKSIKNFFCLFGLTLCRRLASTMARSKNSIHVHYVSCHVPGAVSCPKYVLVHTCDE